MQKPLPRAPENILTKQDLIDYFASGEKPESDWRIGVEFERFAENAKTKKPVPYDGKAASISAFFHGMISRHGWEPVYENDVIIALVKNGQAVTLEPGGQVELSGSPLPTLHNNCAEVQTYMKETQEIASELGIEFRALGFHPDWKREEMPWMPKARYAVMRDYMPKKGKLGIDMMQRTATVQVNLDYSSEADMVKKMRVGDLVFAPDRATWEVGEITRATDHGAEGEIVRLDLGTRCVVVDRAEITLDAADLWECAKLPTIAAEAKVRVWIAEGVWDALPNETTTTSKDRSRST
jgi:hypothetical protein